MPKFGICTSLENATAAKAAGWDYVEESVQGLLQGEVSDADWTGAKRAAGSALPIPVANLFVPGSVKITGPQADLDAQRKYVTTVFGRAKQIGLKTIVFGSAGLGNVPDGFDRKAAENQASDFMAMFTPIAEQHGVTVVIEPLNKGECNILNTVGESMNYVRAINRPGLQCLVDSYHFWLENEPLETLRASMKSIKHVHVADKDGRTAPGDSGTSDYKPFFKVLKDANYDGLISVEAPPFKDIAKDGPRILKYLKDNWAAA